MSFLAASLSRVKPSATIAVTQKARDLRAAGREVIDLSRGRAGFRHAGQHQGRGDRRHPPRRDQVHAGRRHRAAEEGDRRTSSSARTGSTTRPEQVIVGTGGKQILYNAFVATLNPGDEVLIPAPYWVSYPEMVLINGGEPRFVECPIETGFKLTPEALDARDHAAHQVADLQRPVEPDRRRLQRRRAEGAGRGADAPSAGLGADRRHVRASALHRRGHSRRWRRSSRACTSAR